jgi:uncharacterized DUF497 family protein
VTELQFQWDVKKDAQNLRKHGVSFREAVSVFSDDSAVLLDDPEHSFDEDRFLLLGLSVQLRLLVVRHCHREAADVIRIISARKATRRERVAYSQRWKP